MSTFIWLVVVGCAAVMGAAAGGLVELRRSAKALRDIDAAHRRYTESVDSFKASTDAALNAYERQVVALKTLLELRGMDGISTSKDVGERAVASEQGDRDG